MRRPRRGLGVPGDSPAGCGRRPHPGLRGGSLHRNSLPGAASRFPGPSLAEEPHVKRFYAALLALPVAVAISSAPAHAGLRAPQIGFGVSALQNHLDAQGESINVLADQQDALEWGATISGN